MGAIGEAFFLAVTWAFLGFLVAIPAMKVIHLWLVDQVWGLAAALTVLLGIIVSLAIIMKVLGMPGAVIYAVALNLFTAFSPYLEARSERRALQAMRNGDMARYRKMIRIDPQNAAAHGSLADAYAEQGDYDMAISEYETAIALERSQSDSDLYRYRLKHARAAKDGTAPQTIAVCEQCGCETPLVRRVCRKCGAPLRTGFFAWLLKPANLKVVLLHSAAVLAGITVLGMLFSALPFEAKGAVLLATLIVSAFLVLRR